MAELDAVDRAQQQHGHEVAEARFHGRIGIDVDLGDPRAGLVGKRRKLGAHLVAEMAIRADEERELSRCAYPAIVGSYSPFPIFSVV